MTRQDKTRQTITIITITITIIINIIISIRETRQPS